MSISRQDVQHIAHLARIELTKEEEEKLAGDLAEILEFVEKLNEVNTEGVQPMAGGTTLENVMREDEQIDKNLEGKSVKLLDAAPDRHNGYVRVKKIFE